MIVFNCDLMIYSNMRKYVSILIFKKKKRDNCNVSEHNADCNKKNCSYMHNNIQTLFLELNRAMKFFFEKMFFTFH